MQGPPGDSLQPEATGAGMEETKCLKPFGQSGVSLFGVGSTLRRAR